MRRFRFAFVLALMLLVWIPQIGDAIADPNVTTTPRANAAVATFIPSGAVGVLYDPESRYQNRDPRSARYGDQGFVVVIGPGDGVRYARVLIHITYSDDSRNADYEVGPSTGNKIDWVSRAVDKWPARRVLVDLKGVELTKLGGACWLRRPFTVRSPIVFINLREPLHPLIEISRRPVSVVYRDGAHSMELQCDPKSDKLESDIADVLTQLKLTW